MYNTMSYMYIHSRQYRQYIYKIKKLINIYNYQGSRGAKEVGIKRLFSQTKDKIIISML